MCCWNPLASAWNLDSCTGLASIAKWCDTQMLETGSFRVERNVGNSFGHFMCETQTSCSVVGKGLEAANVRGVEIPSLLTYCQDIVLSPEKKTIAADLLKIC